MKRRPERAPVCRLCRIVAVPGETTVPYGRGWAHEVCVGRDLPLWDPAWIEARQESREVYLT